jgi:hypothetical protein
VPATSGTSTSSAEGGKEPSRCTAVVQERCGVHQSLADESSNLQASVAMCLSEFRLISNFDWSKSQKIHAALYN